MIHLKMVRDKMGLGVVELGALLGTGPSAVSHNANRSGNMPGTNLLYWFLERPDGIPKALEYWMYTKPKNQEHFNVLMEIGREHLKEKFPAWAIMMRINHPEFAPKLTRAVA